MLTPEQLERYPKALVELYALVEEDIIAFMAERIAAVEDFIPATEWQFRKLLEMGMVRDEILRRLARATRKSVPQLERILAKAAKKALSVDDAIYRKAGLAPSPIEQSPALIQVLETGLRQTKGLFENLTRTTANTATKQFERALDRAWLQVQSGALDHVTATRNAIKDLANKGLATITYPSGHTDYMDVAVRRAVLTGVNQTALKLQDARAAEMGCDLVEVSAHAGARNTGVGPENHAEWQGKIYSRSGTHPKYPSLVEKTGYGTGPGLGGWNCRHNMYPFIEGVSKPTYTQAQLDDMNAPKYEYEGRKITEYEATQIQRYNERKIRKWKRELKGMEAAGLPTDEAKAKLSKWLKEQEKFLDQTGLKRQYDRERIE